MKWMTSSPETHMTRTEGALDAETWTVGSVRAEPSWAELSHRIAVAVVIGRTRGYPRYCSLIGPLSTQSPEPRTADCLIRAPLDKRRSETDATAGRTEEHCTNRRSEDEETSEADVSVNPTNHEINVLVSKPRMPPLDRGLHELKISVIFKFPQAKLTITTVR